MESITLERFIFFLLGYNRLLQFDGYLSAGQSLVFTKQMGFVFSNTITVDYYIGSIRRQFTGVATSDIIFGPVNLSVVTGQVCIYSIIISE